MKVLVVGGGGREHALCWKLGQSPNVDKVFCAPGNAGIERDAEIVDIPVDALDELAAFAGKNRVELTVVGPEVPLCAGIVDVFKARGLRVFGPDKAASRLEGSKAFSKTFMEKYDIPTATAKTFSADQKDEALRHVDAEFDKGVEGLVVKAAGLAAGKGVIVAASREQASRGVEECFGGAFGDAGSEILLEELLVGEEASILALTDGKTIRPLASSQDHKRQLDGDRGPNTGGMGAYSSAPVVTDDLQNQINRHVLDNFLRGVQAENLDFHGVIYAGVMVTKDGPKVLEFNVRFGDPETQPVLTRLESDLADAMIKTADGQLAEADLRWTPDAAVCVVMASGGYPGSYDKGHPISGLDEAEADGTKVFHAGTARERGRIVNHGGRVLGVTATGRDIRAAVDNAYRAVEKISWEEAFFRKDIARRAL